MREAILIQCTGAAHSNAHIDHCLSCAPFWGTYPACPDCEHSITPPRESRLALKGRCTNSACVSVRRWFLIPQTK